MEQIHASIIEGLFLEKAHSEPHCFLGVQSDPLKPGSAFIRLWRPGAQECFLNVRGETLSAKKVHESGLFECAVSADLRPSEYKIYHQNGLLAHDPYAFSPTIGPLDLYFFSKGVHYNLYEILGARLFTSQEGISGVRFAVWAPNARRVALVGDFNHWDGRVCPMRCLGSSGVWEIFIPGLTEGEKYKFEIHTKEGHRLLKSDPYAHSFELRPKNAATVFDVNRFVWTDQNWQKKRGRVVGGEAPLSIYEVHLGSWQKENGQFLNYRELAVRLAAYCKEMGFTHVELMPVQEHPLDESWGYQVTGYFAVTSRYGTPEDFQYFVNHLHEQDIGVLIDWVPAHFPADDFSLVRFDGSALFEHADPKQGFHPHWNTWIFNYGRLEVANFLIASALFWLEKMHIDGLRVDAVASMIYLDYGRDHGEWIPNAYGTNFNLEAIEFIKHLNSIVHQKYPGVLMIAEESTAFDGVTRPVEWGGLGFDLKWNMGWMNDTLRYFCTDPIFRHYHQHLLTFVMIYAFSERFLLVLSHDEVVHGKSSLLSKMPGDDWQKFASLRLLYSYLICQPGKKLLFMGAEFGQWEEWNCREELSWHLCKFDRHQILKHFFKTIQHLYLKNPALWQRDFTYEGFEWLDFDDDKNSVVSYLRKSDTQLLACVHHFTPSYFSEYFIPLDCQGELIEIFNSDSEECGGSGKINNQKILTKDVAGKGRGFIIQLPPLATMIFEVRVYHDR